MAQTPLESEVRRTFYGDIVLIPTISNPRFPSTTDSSISRAAVRVSDDPPGQFRLVTTEIFNGEVRLKQSYCYRKDGHIPTWYAHIKPQSREWRTTVEDDYIGMYDDGCLEFQALEALLQTSTQPQP